MNSFITRILILLVLLISLQNSCYSQIPYGDNDLKKRIKISYYGNFVDTIITGFGVNGIQTFPTRDNITTTHLIKCDTLDNSKNSIYLVCYFEDSSIKKFQYTKYNDSTLRKTRHYSDSISNSYPTYTDAYKKFYLSKNPFFEKGQEIHTQYEGVKNSPSFADTVNFSENRITNVYRVISINESNGESYVSEKTKKNRKGLAKKSRIRFYNNYFESYFDEKYIYSYDTKGRIIKVVQYDTNLKTITSITYYEYY